MSHTAGSLVPSHLTARLTDPALAASLSRFVRTRVPESDADDVVQQTLADALASAASPASDEDVVPWVFGICRHKIIDWFRRMRREIPRDLEDDDGSVPAQSSPTGAMDLLRWARKELPHGGENEQTLEWMLREGAGEPLEAIAVEANVPAPTVRQRVSRLRRYYKAKWAAQAAALAALLVAGVVVFFLLRQKHEEIAPVIEPPVAPSTEPSPRPEAPPLAAPEVPALDTAPDAALQPSAAPKASAAPTTRAPTAPSKIAKPRAKMPAPGSGSSL